MSTMTMTTVTGRTSPARRAATRPAARPARPAERPAARAAARPAFAPAPPRPAACTTTRPSVRPAPVRLTRRGRWVLTALLLGAVLALSLVMSGGVVATGERGAAPATTSVVVGQGDSLWSLAAAVSEPGGTRDLVYEIKELNHLTSSTVVPGQRLLIPAS